jgi:uroporphyrinogen-III synthase
VLVVTSSEAIDSVVASFDGDARRRLFASARVLAPHERIVARARAAGFADVRLTALDIDAIRQAARAQ